MTKKERPSVWVGGGRPLDPGASHPGLVRYRTPWAAFTALASDEIEAVQPVRSRLPEDRHYPVVEDILARLGGVDRVDQVGTAAPPLIAGMWPGKRDGIPGGIGSDYSGALFGRDVFRSLRSLRRTYPLRRYPNLLLAVDELLRRQGRERDDAVEAADYERRNEAPGKLFHELRDPSDPLAIEISRVTGCAWPWFAGDDVTGEGVSYVMEESLADPRLLQRRVVQSDGRTVTYAEAVVAGLLWELRAMTRSGHRLILSWRLGRPPGSEWMPPVGSVWRDSADSFLRLDGTLPTRPVVLVEVQAVLYRSLRLAAQMARACPSFAGLLAGAIERGLPGEAPSGLPGSPEKLARYLDDTTEGVRASFFETLWVNNEAGGFPGYFAEREETGDRLAVTPVLASGVIDSVLSGLYDGEHMRERLYAVMRNIYDPAYGLRAALGPRSLGRFSPHYSPSGWANGSIWPHLNDTAAAAAARHGLYRCAHRDSLLVHHICMMTRAVPEVVRDSDEPAIDPVRVRVWRSQPERHLTTAVEPGKPWQLWTVAALASSWERARDCESRPLAAPSRDIARMDAELSEGMRCLLPSLPASVRPIVVWTGREGPRA